MGGNADENSLRLARVREISVHRIAEERLLWTLPAVRVPTGPRPYAGYFCRLDVPREAVAALVAALAEAAQLLDGPAGRPEGAA